MIVLLDTHALIWALENSPRLSATARAAIVDPDNTVLASVASAWEIAVKKALGKLAAPDDLETAIESARFTARVITFADAHRIESLPHHHRDPFDRMLVAQALVDGIPIVTSDPLVTQYPVQSIW